MSWVLGLAGTDTALALIVDERFVLASSTSIVKGEDVNVLFLLEIGLLPCIGQGGLLLGFSNDVSACKSVATGLIDSRSGDGGLVRCGLMLGGDGK